MGVLLWRGFGIDNVMSQCFGNADDTSGKGRQMPVVSSFHHFSVYHIYKNLFLNSTSARPPTISTPSHLPSQRKYRKRLALHTPSNAPHPGAAAPLPHASSARVLHRRVTFTQGCSWPPPSRLPHSSSRGTTGLRSPRLQPNSTMATASRVAVPGTA
jgi:hypothetical protein